jgi:glucosamine-6-phosphate deaminase
MSNFCKNFKFNPHPDLPFRDVEVLDMCRTKKAEDYLALNETRPNWKLEIVDDDFIWYAWLTDMFKRIKDSDEKDEKCVMILPNPAAIYKRVAYMLNKCNISCRNLIVFTMDEWADQDGNIAPVTYPASFTSAFMRFFYNVLKPELRPKEKNIHFPTNENINDYSKMIQDEGEGDIAYSACGWSGHAAFIDAVPQFGVDGNNIVPVDEWLKMGARVADLHILTQTQNSLHSSFGMSGDIGFVPPRAATIGPRDLVNCKHIFEFHNFMIGNTDISWEKLMSRLVCFGPVSPLVPDSLIQVCNAEVYISELFASPIEYDIDRQYR